MGYCSLAVERIVPAHESLCSVRETLVEGVGFPILALEMVADVDMALGIDYECR